MPSVPTVCFCGWGRAGKDECGLYLGEITSLVYHGSLSWVGLPVVAKALGIPEQVAWDTRHARRMEWYNILNDYRRDDPSRLIKDSLKRGEIVVGVRDRLELLTAKKEGLLTHTIWVERPDTPPDPTVTYSRQDCDMILDNNGTLEDLKKTVKQWAQIS